MKKFIICSMLALQCSFAGAFVGYYQTIDDETDKPKSIVALYKYIERDDDGDIEEKLGGRVIALYDTEGNGTISETLNAPVRVASEVAGSPKMAGLDVIWDMEYDDGEYEDGRIMDPKTGKIYRAVIWQDESKTLNVRGKIGPFGRTQVWNVLTIKDLPADLQKLDTSKWEPKISR